jgi:hypothetical protein
MTGNPRRITVESLTQDHALQIVNSITVRDGKLAIVEGEDTWRALRAAQRVLDTYGRNDEALAEATWICVAWWNERMLSFPCHYCLGVESFEVDASNNCVMCKGTHVHPTGDDPHDDGAGWNGDGCGVCNSNHG